MSRIRVSWAAAPALLWLACAPPAVAQNITGTVLGDVKDNSGAAVPRAEVSLTNQATNQATRLFTDSLGHYEAPYLRPGEYLLRVSAAGFKTATRDRLTLEVDARMRVDFTLEVGDVSTTVEVTAGAAMIETETGSLGQVVAERSLQELPLQGRNVFDLIGLAPGVQESPLATGGVVSTGSADGNIPTFAYSDFSINGGRMRTNDYLLDGVSIMLPANNNFAISPTPDGTQEFKVMTSSYSPQFGRTGGGVVNVVTKGGGNHFHGAAYEFHRNHILRAANYFANARGQGRGVSAFNLFGGSAGGPMRRNRTFFFAEYQGHREWTALGGGVLTVPTAAERAGDFSQRLASNGQQVNLFNPYTTRRVGTSNVRDPFPGNVIPASLFDKAAVKVLSYVGLPNMPGEGFARVNNFVYAPLNRVGSDQWSGRIDHRFTDRHAIFGRLTRNTGLNRSGGAFGTIADSNPGNNVNRVSNAVLNDTLTLSARRVLNLRYGFTRRYEGRVPVGAGQVRLTELGFPAYIPAAAVEELFPSFTVSGYSNFGTPSSVRIRAANDIHTWVAEQTQILGKHTLVYGADIRLYNQNTYQGGTPSGAYSFTESFSQDPTRPGVASGNSVASLLLGYGSGSINNFPAFAVRNYYAGLFFNDDLRLGKLTINLGLRWDYEQPRTERYNRFAVFRPDRDFPLTVPGLTGLRGVLTWAGRDGEPRGAFDSTYRDFGPRVGLAYRLRRDTAIRAGYGIFFLPRIGAVQVNTYGAAGSFVTTTWVASVDGITPTNPLSNPFPNGLLLPPETPGEKLVMGETIRVGDRANVANSYMQQWNFGLQRGLVRNLVLGLTYAGSQGTHLPVAAQINQVDPVNLRLGSALSQTVPNPFRGMVRSGTLASVNLARNQLLRPFPHYGSMTVFQKNMASSKYHSFLVQIEKRFSKGYNFMVSYTASKLIDNGSGRIFNYTAGEPPIQNVYDLRAERAVSPQDVSQRLVISHVVRLPSRNRWLKGWALSGTFTWNTGFPLALTSSGSNTYLFTAVTRPNNAGRSGRLEGRVEDRLTRYFDTSAFSVPPNYTLGNTGRTLPDARTPSRWNENLAASRTVRLSEWLNLMIRVESFNLSNTPFFDPPATTLGTGTFGMISTSRNERQLQFSAKLLF